MSGFLEFNIGFSVGMNNFLVFLWLLRVVFSWVDVNRILEGILVKC